MKKYIVGGFCRDKLLGLKPKDKDYVLVGAKPRDIAYLESIGYKQVGADFPVYISPEGDEYALARKERKTGSGYNGFSVETQDVTIEEDLSRRDLTINAIAWDNATKTHVDPFGGKLDLKNKVLRHVSPAFGEDPLRILRLPRLKTRYPDFTVHPSTDELVRQMVAQGDLEHLAKERIYVEFEKAFADGNCNEFLLYLKSIGALAVLLPDFNCTAKEIEIIKKISERATENYLSDFIWCVLLSNATPDKKFISGHVQLSVKSVKFSNFIKRFSDNIIKFRKKKPDEMVTMFTEMNIKNNGGEEFLYKVIEYFVLRREVDAELALLIIKVFDRWTDAPIGNIEDMIQNGTLAMSDIREYVSRVRTEELQRMFS